MTLTEGAIREVAALMDTDVSGSLDELGNVLLQIAGLMAKLKRQTAKDAAVTTELSALDVAFGRSITLTREVRERLRADARPHHFVSLTRVAREVVGQLQGVLPEGVWLGVGELPQHASIVAAEHVQLRRLLTAIIARALDSLQGPGVIEVSVRELPKSGRPEVGLEVRCPSTIPADDAELASTVRPVISALGGKFEIGGRSGGPTTMTVLLANVC
jgi:hypothetical protein